MRRLVLLPRLRGPNADVPAGVDLNAAMELECRFVVAGPTNQLPGADADLLAALVVEPHVLPVGAHVRDFDIALRGRSYAVIG